MIRQREVRRYIGKAVLSLHARGRRDDRDEKCIERRALALVVAAQADRAFELFADRERSAAVDADAAILERRLRRVLNDRKVHEGREHERGVPVDGILLVVLGEREHAGLPFQRHIVGERDRCILRGREPNLLRELKVALGVLDA